jgi:uncharacterized damage-inducible protein DinB
MTKDYFIQLADYTIWANDKVHSWLEKITDEQWKQPIVSSFNSLEATVVHTAGAERIWLDRLNHVEAPVFLTAVFKGSKKEGIEIWRNTSLGLKSFVEKFDEANLQQPLRFTRVDGNTYELAHDQLFLHVFNHSTYHRGQMVTMLRQVGFTDMSSIDISTYFWSKKN